MKQLTATDYEAEEGFMIVRKSNGRIYGYSIQLGSADTIDEFEEKAFTEEERAAFWESIGMEDPKKMNSQERSSIATIGHNAR